MPEDHAGYKFHGRKGPSAGGAAIPGNAGAAAAPRNHGNGKESSLATLQASASVMATRGMKRIQRQVNTFLSSGAWQATSFAFTIVALFLDPLRDASLDRDTDQSVNLIIFVSLVFFVVEMVLLSFAQKGECHPFEHRADVLDVS